MHAESGRVKLKQAISSRLKPEKPSQSELIQIKPKQLWLGFKTSQNKLQANENRIQAKKSAWLAFQAGLIDNRLFPLNIVTIKSKFSSLSFFLCDKKILKDFRCISFLFSSVLIMFSRGKKAKSET